MPITLFSSRQFNQDTGRAKKAAANGYQNPYGDK
jgi:hypothetical protein